MALKLLQLSNSPHPHGDALKAWLRVPGDGRASFVLESAKKQQRGAAAGEVSHYLMSGGRWNIPVEYNDEFMWHYAVSMFQDHAWAVVERRTEYFRFHVDMDFAQAQEVTQFELRRYVVVVQEVLRKFFFDSSNDYFECVVSAAPTKAIPSKDPLIPDTVKTGYHIIWPHLWVTEQQALDVRASVLVYLARTHGYRVPPTQNMWEDVVDESIYINNGLRMIGATKWSACKCKRKKGETGPRCVDCGGKGVVCENRPYYVTALWDSECNPVTRFVARPHSDSGPLYRTPAHLYSTTANEVRACDVPDWAPRDDASDGQVPLADLLLFGDPWKVDLDSLRSEPPHAVWALVQRLHNTLRLTSLRMDAALATRVSSGEVGAIPEFKRYLLAPASSTVQDIVARRARENKGGVRRVPNARAKVELLGEFHANQKPNIQYLVDDQLTRDIEDFIRHNVGVRPLHKTVVRPYADVDVTRIVHYETTKTPTRFFVHVKSTGSAYCRNKDGDHFGHSIYFEIGPDPKRRGAKSVFQKCFCRCANQVGRNSGPCKSYRNKEADFPSSLRARLFRDNAQYAANDEAVAKEKVVVPDEVVDVRKLLSIFDDSLDMEAFEAYRTRKRAADLELAADADKRARSSTVGE